MGKIYDLIIIGAGPAGLTAAIYAQRAGLDAVVLEKTGIGGGQLINTDSVENYPGIPVMSGNEYADTLMSQILDHGAEIEFENALSVTRKDKDFLVNTEEGTVHEGRSIILATGVKHRQLQLPGENELVGNGISYCAVCDGDFFADQDVCVAGGGNSALQDALLLSQKCRSVTILQDMPFLTGEQVLQERLVAKENVTILTGVKITQLYAADEKLTGVEVSTGEGASRPVPCTGLFIAIGLVPDNAAFTEWADLNAWGYFDTSEVCTTKTPGIFVAGDCRSKTIRQLTTAVGDGAVASLAACRYLDTL